MTQSWPFAGIEVVEFGQFIAVPFCGQLLAEGGAHVVNVESLEGDPVRQLALHAIDDAQRLAQSLAVAHEADAVPHHVTSRSARWDIVQIQWDADLDPDETLYPELHSTETWNAGKWVNKDFDRAVELAREEHDFKKRKKAYEDSPQVREGLPDDPPGSSTCTGSGSIGRDSGLRRE